MIGGPNSIHAPDVFEGVADARLGDPAWVDNWTIGRGLRFELIETSTRRVVICQDEVAAEELRAFEAPDGFAHALAGAAVADQAFFSRSPGAEQDGPVEVVELGGRRFAFIARPVSIETRPSGAVDMVIDKHHSMLYRAGRTLDVLDLGDGTVATPAWAAPDPSGCVSDEMLDDGRRLHRVRLTDDLLTTIPDPARVIVLDGAFGFHGPVDRTVVERVSEEIPR